MKILHLIIFMALIIVNSVSYDYQRTKRQDILFDTGNNDPDSCRNPRGEPGLCVNIRQCPALLSILKNLTPNGRQFLRASLCGYDGIDPIVCCPNLRTREETTPVPLPIVTAAPFDPDDSPYFGCGYSNKTHTRIVGGVEASLGAWPWIAALGFNRTAGRTEFLCGGALITTKHVITAAHCIRDDLVVVRLGEHDLSSNSDGAKPITIPVARRIPHQQFNPTSFENDIAILELAQPIAPSFRIHPICLPASPQLRSDTFVNTSPFVAGWGSIRFNGPSSPVLMEIMVPVITNSDCKEKYKAFRSQVIDDRVMCAGRGKKDACQGDSGGPMMWPSRNDSSTFYLLGVVSFGFRCAEPNFPGVYTRITYYIDWIQRNLR